MPKLNDYQHFSGRHWETGSVHNHWAYRRFKAPHTQQPYSEALLMGISGGIVMGYFSFAYAGYDPHVSILTRNTFDPLDALLTRLGVEQILLQTTNPKKAVQNLTETLQDGVPPLVWVDQYSLPYNALPNDPGMWQMAPLVIFGYDQVEASVTLADRACVPLTTTTAEFDAARARVKQDKFKLLTLEMPDADKVAAAVNAGIWSCIKLFTEKPPKGGRDNFGFAAYQRWADLLTKPKQRLSWEKEFPPGRKMLAGLTSTFTMVALFGQDGIALDAERGTYANFLEEAAEILNKAALRHVATQFRLSGQAWQTLAFQLLPDSVPPFQETRQLLVQRHRAFLERGNAALDELRAIDTRLAAIQTAIDENFPLTDAEVGDLRAHLADQILHIRDLEQTGIDLLKTAMQ
jgi:hypothetical protein